MEDKETCEIRDEILRKQIEKNAKIVLEIVNKYKTKNNGDKNNG